MASRNFIVYSGPGSTMTAKQQKEYKLNAIAAGLERCAIKSIGDLNADIPYDWDGKKSPGLQSIPESKKEDRVKLIRDFIATGAWPKSVDLRELAPLTDLVVPTALDSHLTAALAAVATVYSCFQAIAAPQLLQGKLMVVYGVSIDDPSVPMPVSRLIFRKGGAAGNIQGQYDLEPLGVKAEYDGYLSEPQVIDYQDPFAIQVRCRFASAVACIVHLHNFLFESTGLVIA